MSMARRISHRTSTLRTAAVAGLLFGFGVHDTSAELVPGETYTIRSADSQLTYRIVHKLQRVDGVSKSVEGRARILTTGQAQITIRVPADSFYSRNSSRDAQVKEALDVGQHPVIELKGFCDGLGTPARFPSTLHRTCQALVNFHGVQKTVDVAVRLSYESGDRIRANGSLALSLDAFKVERPSLMFVKVDDLLLIDADIVFGK